MDIESRPSRPGGSRVQLVGTLLVVLVAAAWAFSAQDAQPRPDANPASPSLNILVQWTHFVTSVVLLGASLYAGCFAFTNEQKHRCHPKCHFLFVAVAIPGFISLITLKDGLSDDVLILALSIQLVVVAFMYCVVATEYHPSSNKRITLSTLLRGFMHLDLGLQIFFVFSLFVASFSVFPYAWRAFVPSGFWEARVVGLDGVVALGNAMAALLGYQLLHFLPPKAGLAHIISYSLCAIAPILQVSLFRYIVLIVPVLVQTAGIFWDILNIYESQASELQETSEDCKYWQSMTEQLQAINNVHESAITAKSSFLAGLAYEMKSIVHGTSMVMSMLNDTDIQPNQGTYIAKLDRAVDRLTNLVREAQYYFEVESQKSTTDSVPFRLDQLLEEVINSTPIRTHLEERDVDVSYLVETKVPMCLLGDYFRLKNILLRLLTNAIKATVQGEIVIWVRLNSPMPNTPSSPSTASETSPPDSPQAPRQVLRVSSDPATKLSATLAPPDSPQAPRQVRVFSDLTAKPSALDLLESPPASRQVLRMSSDPSGLAAKFSALASPDSPRAARQVLRGSFDSSDPHDPGAKLSVQRPILRVSPHPVAKFSELKISKLIPHDVLSTALPSPLPTSHSAPTTPQSHRDMSPRNSASLANSQSLNPSPRNRRNPYHINVNTNFTDSPLSDSPKISAYTPRTSSFSSASPSPSSSSSSSSSFNLQRSASLNALRTPTPRGSIGFRPLPEFDHEHNFYGSPPLSPSPILPPTSPSSLYQEPISSSQGDDVVHLSISVVDTGIGIPPEDLTRIFEPFGMVNRKREDTDLGLGLSICKQLARLFGGNLTVQSELSRGTSFTLTCPFKVNSNTSLQNINNLFGTGIILQREWGIGKTICVIDNNASIGEVCKMHLAPVGCEILYYPASTEALSQMKVLVELGRKLDVVLIGYRLYGTNGEETAKLIRSDPDLQNIPIVFMCTAKQRKQVTLSNAHFLYKPLKKEQLMTVVHMLCTAQTHVTPPSPETTRDFSVIPDSRTPHSPLTSSSPTVQRNPLTTSHRLFPNSLITPLALPTLPPLIEQDEKPAQPSPPATRRQDGSGPTSPTNLRHENLVKVQQLQQVQQALGEQVRAQQETDKVNDLQLQQPLPPPIKTTDIPPHQIPSVLIPSTPRDPTPTSTPRTPIVPTTPRVAASSPRTTASSSPEITAAPVAAQRRTSVSEAAATPVPFSLPAPEGTPAPAPAENAAPTTPPPKKETILLVEDNPINAKIASAVLRRHQFEVELAGNGQIALEKIKLTHENFQLILMDIHMPVMDGLTCARLVRQFEKEHNLVQIPIIALTADATSLHRTACLEAGCNEFMSKPLDYPLLIEILKKLSAGGTFTAQP